MAFLYEHCHFESLRVGTKISTQPFSCGNEDLDGFFHEDFLPYEDELMGKSYCYITDAKPHTIVAAFTVCNSSIHNRMLSSGAKGSLSRNVSEEKQNINFPAVLIGRLGINKEFHRKHIGTELMDFIKQWFISPDNKTGCRYLIVDAYNNEDTLNYYIRNGFNFIFTNLESEKRYRRLEKVEGELHTRLMYFDLILTKRNIPNRINP